MADTELLLQVCSYANEAEVTSQPHLHMEKHVSQVASMENFQIFEYLVLNYSMLLAD